MHSQPLRAAIVLPLVISLALSGCAQLPPAVPTPPALPAAPAAPPAAAAGGAGQAVTVNMPKQECCPHPTLWEFLGVKTLLLGLNGCALRLRNRLGAIYPGIEAKPPLLAISDPKNLESPNPAVKTAAEVKADEDAAEQKMKALMYLGKIGCTKCYPEVEAAIMAGLDDCTEPVRFGAATAIRDGSGCPCQKCKSNSCCGPKVIAKLRKVAYDMDDYGCYKEPSARVRRMARLALSACGCVPTEAEKSKTDELPKEGPPEGPPEATVKRDAAKNDAPKTEVANSDAPKADVAKNEAATAMATTAAATRREVTRDVTPVSSSEANVETKDQMPAEAKVEPIPAVTEVAEPPKPTVEIRFNPAPTTPATHDHGGGCPCRRGLFGAAATDPNRVVATIDGEKITEQELCGSLSAELDRLDAQPPSDAREKHREQLVQAGLSALVERKLLCQAARRAGLSDRVTPASFQGGSGTQSAVQISEQQLAADWLKRNVQPPRQLSDLELLAHYHQNRERYATIDEVHCELWVATVEQLGSAENARAVMRQLIAGPNDAALRARLQTQLLHENIGWQRRASFASPSVAAVIFDLPRGAMCPFAEDAGILQSVRVLDRRTVPATWEMIAPQVAAEQAEQRQRDAERAYLDGLKKQSRVWTVFDGAETASAAPMASNAKNRESAPTFKQTATR